MSSRLTTLLAVGAIVIGAALVSVPFLQRDVGPESPVPRRVPPAMPGAEAGKLDYIRKADAIADPIERCKAYPPPSGFDWPRATTDALCVDLLTPRLPWARIRQWILDGEGESLDSYFDGLVEGYGKGTVPEGVLWYAYGRNFENTGAEFRSLIDQWMAQRPESAHAQLALAGHHLANAWGYRGQKLASEIPDDDVARMREEIEQAVAAAQRAVAMDARLLPAYTIAARLDPLGADDDVADRMAEAGLAERPDSYYLRDALMFRARPDWGGSFDALDAIAEDGMAHADANPRMPILKAFAQASRGFAEHREERHELAAPLFDEALAIAPDVVHLWWGASSQAHAGNAARAVEYRSQTLRFFPGGAQAINWRAEQLIKLGQRDWALAELEAAITPNYNDNLEGLSMYIRLLQQMGRDTDAEAKLKQLLVANPRDRALNRQLAAIHLYRLRRFDAAKTHIDTLLALDPDDGAALLLQLDYLQNSNATGLRAAAERFVAHADQSDNEQAIAYPKVVRWLADPANK